MIEWLFIGAVIAFGVGIIARNLADEARQLREAAAIAAGHRSSCLVARYPQPPDAAGFPWCTCAWKTARHG